MTRIHLLHFKCFLDSHSAIGLHPLNRLAFIGYIPGDG